MTDEISKEVGTDQTNSDVSGIVKRMRARLHAREQKNAMLVNPVKEISVPPNEIRRGFTYFEQTLSDTSSTDSLTDLINKNVSSEKPDPIVGIVDGSMIRWSGNVPSHPFLLVNHPDKRSLNEYKGVKIQIDFYPNLQGDFRVMVVMVEGHRVDRSNIDRAAKYLSRNIKGHDNAMMRACVYEDGRDMFIGALKDYGQHG